MRHRIIRTWQPKQLDEPLEVVVAVVFDFDFSFFEECWMATWVARCSREPVGDGADVDVHLAGGGCFTGLAGFVGFAVEQGLREFFSGADGELAADDLVGGEELGVVVLDGEDGFGMADGEAGLGD